MQKKHNSSHKKSISKIHKDRGLQYYKNTLRKKDIASPVISLPEFINSYSKFKPNVDKLIYGGSFIPNEPHNCNGNSLYITCKLLKGEMNYVEGVLRIKNELYHHCWIYSPKLRCYIDPTLFPKKDFKYYISDILEDKELPILATPDEINNSFNPAFVHENVKEMVKIIHKK